MWPFLFSQSIVSQMGKEMRRCLSASVPRCPITDMLKRLWQNQSVPAHLHVEGRRQAATDYFARRLCWLWWPRALAAATKMYPSIDRRRAPFWYDSMLPTRVYRCITRFTVHVFSLPTNLNYQRITDHMYYYYIILVFVMRILLQFWFRQWRYIHFRLFTFTHFALDHITFTEARQ